MDWKGVILLPLIRHGLTGVGGTLVGLGWIGTGDQASFVTIGTGIAMGAISYGWSWWEKRGKVLVDAAVAQRAGVAPAK
jgi:hypothetical protein